MQLITTLFFFVLPWLSFNLAMSNNSSTIDRAGCPTKCGNVTVEYPFGIGVGTGCSISSPWYDINCSTAFNPPKPYLAGTNGESEVLDISNTTIRLKSNGITSRCNDQSEQVTRNFSVPYGGDENSPYSFSSNNKFFLVGCDDVSFMQWLDTNNKLISACTTVCLQEGDLANRSCSGIGCCASSIPRGVKNFQIFLISFEHHMNVLLFIRCGHAFLGDSGSYKFRSSDIVDDDDDQKFEQRIVETVPMVLDWVIGNQTCEETRKLDQLACQENSICVDFDTSIGGYHCKCSDGYEGNPYLKPGCQDIDECEKNPCHEKAICINTPGSYSCSCQHGYFGSGKKFRYGCMVLRHSNRASLQVKIGLSVSIGLLLLVIVTYWLHRVAKKKRKINRKKKYFKRNGGLLLQQEVSTNERLVEKTKLFTIKELSKATDQFNESRILGRGGQGTVYKGMLSDGRTVAIKKSKLVGENQLQPFINEVVILSQLNHRNVVKLLGCCLETEVPLLVYEFIPNRTLFYHIHDPNVDFPITWDMRLRIAVEIAGALAYLHYETSLSIYHRDIKTSNILLDENYRPKVSDFGTSRSIATDKTHITTIVRGTFGYLDPEYFQSNQFTDKSDVYSFGVVLVELLSGQEAISSSETEDGRGLATRFLASIEQNCLRKILDPKILEQDKDGEIIAVASLAGRCLNLNGKKRPTMKEVAMELENIRLSNSSVTIRTNFIRISPEMGSPSLSDFNSTWTSSDGDSRAHLDTKPLMHDTA